MYLINKENNSIHSIARKTFSELGLKERDHLQEWISDNPEVLGEELLIIQKEFNGFNDTNERLDLLALDKQGNLVVIENKLDDTGKDVVWQAIKYASYCSSLSKDQIKDIYQDYLIKYSHGGDAEKNLMEFFYSNTNEYIELAVNQGQTQRIILVAANFRKEVTSTVLWLMNYKLKIQCIKVAPYEWEGNLFLDVEQIIPVKDIEDYVIKIANKMDIETDDKEATKHRYQLRIGFWQRLLPEMNKVSQLFQNVNPSKDGWIACGSGVSLVTYNFAVTHKYARAELYIARSIKEENKFIFDELCKNRDIIEKEIGVPLEWERMDDKKTSRIKFELTDVDVFNQNDWDKMTEFLVNAMIRLEKSTKDYLKPLGNKLKNKEADWAVNGNTIAEKISQ